MALSNEVQELVNQKKWKEAYEKAEDMQQDETPYFLVEIEDENTLGYVLGDENKYEIEKDAKKASYWKKKQAGDVAKAIKAKNKDVKTRIVERSAYVQNIGTQGTEKGEVIDLFLKERFPKINLEDTNDILTKWIEELGFSYNTNPFIQFIDEFMKKNEKITNDTLLIINDLYAKDEITTLELQAKTKEGLNNIIFNENLYTLNYEDAEFLVQAYKWLSNNQNIIRHITNSEALKKYNIEDISKINKEKAYEIRNKIIFKTPESISNSPLNSMSDIQREIRFLEAGGEQGVDDYEGSSRKTLNVNDKVDNEAKWKTLTPNNITTAQEAQDLINYLAKEFKLV